MIVVDGSTMESHNGDHTPSADKCIRKMDELWWYLWFKLAPVFSGILIIGNRNASFAFLSYSGTGISRMSIYQMMTSIF